MSASTASCQQQQTSDSDNNNNNNRKRIDGQKISKLDPRVAPFKPSTKNNLSNSNTCNTNSNNNNNSKKVANQQHHHDKSSSIDTSKSSFNQSSDSMNRRKETTNFGKSVVEDEQQQQKPICICNRPRGLIMCRRCGFQDSGRVRTTCDAHKNRHALMDLQVCPDCRSATLKEIHVPT